jgi:integrase
MPKLTNGVPKYRRHKRSGQAIVTLNGRDYFLGPFGTKASHVNYDRHILEWLARGRQPVVQAADLTIVEVADRYWSFAKKKYVRAGRPTPEQFHVKTAIKHLLRLYETHAAIEFGPVHLKVVRDSMIATEDWARSYINQQVSVIVRMFKWAVSESLLPAAIYDALKLVDGLRRNDSAARETRKIGCIDDAKVEATLAHVSPIIRAMIELQRLTGMRPGELCILRPMDIDRTGDTWEYRPTEHKTAHHERDRIVPIGPKGQDILRPFLLRPADAIVSRRKSRWIGILLSVIRSGQHRYRAATYPAQIASDARDARHATVTKWRVTAAPFIVRAILRFQRQTTLPMIPPRWYDGAVNSAGHLIGSGTQPQH